MRRFNVKEIECLEESANEKIKDILDALEIEYVEGSEYLKFKCGIHNGDNQFSAYWSLTTNHFRCMTKLCHDMPITGKSKSIFGLVRGILSNKYNRKISFQESANFIADFLGKSEIRLEDYCNENKELNNIIKKHESKNKKNTESLSKLSSMSKLLNQDNIYYPRRGVTREIIQKYNISVCNNRGKFFYDRALFPVLDETGMFVAGWSGRTLYEKCKECEKFHKFNIACNRFNVPKWLHSKGFKKEKYLYNYNFAKSYIKKSGVAIVCESPGNCWAYEMAGIHNSVAIMGLSMSEAQRKLLQKTGALTIILTLDNDKNKSGKIASEKIIEDLEYYFNIIPIIPTEKNDIAEMKSEEIRSMVQNIIKDNSKEFLFVDSFNE